MELIQFDFFSFWIPGPYRPGSKGGRRLHPSRSYNEMYVCHCFSWPVMLSKMGKGGSRITGGGRGRDLRPSSWVSTPYIFQKESTKSYNDEVYDLSFFDRCGDVSDGCWGWLQSADDFSEHPVALRSLHPVLAELYSNSTMWWMLWTWVLGVST